MKNTYRSKVELQKELLLSQKNENFEILGVSQFRYVTAALSFVLTIHSFFQMSLDLFPQFFHPYTGIMMNKNILVTGMARVINLHGI